MWSLFAIGMLAGALLGLRYKVLVLVPAIFMACTLNVLAYAIGNGILGGSVTLATIGLSSAVMSVALQIGYICGAGLQLVIVSRRGFGFRATTSSRLSARSTSRH
jgi:hypothetical protein